MGDEEIFDKDRLKKLMEKINITILEVDKLILCLDKNQNEN